METYLNATESNSIHSQDVNGHHEQLYQVNESHLGLFKDMERQFKLLKGENDTIVYDILL